MNKSRQHLTVIKTQWYTSKESHDLPTVVDTIFRSLRVFGAPVKVQLRKLVIPYQRSSGDGGLKTPFVYRQQHWNLESNALKSPTYLGLLPSIQTCVAVVGQHSRRGRFVKVLEHHRK